MLLLGLVVLSAWGAAAVSSSAADPPFKRTERVVYGEKRNTTVPTLDAGVALTMDVFQPAAEGNGRGLIFVVSAGWVSNRQMIKMLAAEEFLRRGYTVFAVMHGSQPKFTAPEIVQDIHRAVRFIRHHAKEYRVDPEKLGVYGASAGGHLSLMMGVAGVPGDPQAPDPVDRESSRVAAVAVFFPPTDFLNFGEPGRSALTIDRPAFNAGFDFQEFSPATGRYERITDEPRRTEILRQLSPLYHVTADDAPTLIIHGDADERVPIQQAHTLIDKLREAGVATELIVKQGAGHGWTNWNKDMESLADWFNEHLGPAKGDQAQ